MFQIYIPTAGPDDWQRFLTDPDRHWRSGYSARALAYAWETSRGKGLPAEIAAVFNLSGNPTLQQIEPLVAFPEHHTMLPGGSRASQTDLFVLARDALGALVTIMVEGKVREPFGPTLREWGLAPSAGKRERLTYLQTQLGLGGELPPTIRYQLLHRTASAVVEATRFNAQTAVMLVHSFSQEDLWFDEYADFVRLFGVAVQQHELILLGTPNEVRLYTAWVRGDVKWLTA